MDINFDEVFGVTEGAEEQEIAEPAETETEEGAEEQEVAEPAEEQSAEDNARFAAARRKAEAERDAAVAKAQADAQRMIDDAFKNSGLVNPYTKKPITTKAEYDEYKNRYAEEKRKTVLRKSGMSDEEFQAFVEDLPEVKAARAAKEEAEAAAAKSKVDEQIREIGAMNPEIKTIEDLMQMENYQDFYGYVKRGNSLVDAYKLANFDALTKGAAAGARQAAMNAAQGKGHMAQTSMRGAGAVTVPGDVKEMYRLFNPGATDAEIAAHYARNHKK